ncbi:Tripeptidyl-peptidase sed3 [Erysiphe necator]|nr:Tripeptidyl-peptidase sed3 [Erysiphe necator]
MKLVYAIVLSAAAAVLSQQQFFIGAGDQYKTFEQLAHIPYPWNLKETITLDPKHSFKLRIHLRNQNIQSFQRKVLDLSTPGHPDYGQHMDREAVNNYLAPFPESFDLVQGWLEYEGAGNVTVQNDWIILDTTIEEVEKLLNTKYQVYENNETGQLILRTLSYKLPSSLHSHIDLVAPTIKFSTPSAHRSTLVDWPYEEETKSANKEILENGVSAECNNSITIDCLKDLYNLRDFSPSSNPNNQFALAGFLEEYAQHDDLKKFLSTYEPAAAKSDFSTILINGGQNTQQNTVDYPLNMGEANLDIQYAFLAYPTPSIYISTGGRPPETPNMEVDNEPYLEFLTYLLNATEIPRTLSISYGDSEWTVPDSYARTVCDMFSQLAARGVSVLVSSGDSGSGSNCTETEPSALRYTPSFPASCPFVTTIGATYRVNPEVAVSFSGGGFSDFFPRPEYQDSTVTAYLETADPAFKNYYNTSGRAYPDISAQGVNFHVFVRGTDVLESGTSASAPAMAAIIALLNGERIERGQPPLGFLNPLLYGEFKTAFTDIIGGKTSGCPQVQGSGFAATTGWDPATGFGTPNFKRLQELSNNL